MNGNQQPWKRRNDSAKSTEIQPASSPSSASQPETCQTSVNIGSDDDSDADTSPSVQKKPCSWSKVVVLCYRLLIYACTAFHTAAVALLVGAVVLVLVIICSVSATIAALPLLLVSFLVLRLIQFFRYGDDYDKTIQLKLFIRTWILLDLFFYLGTLWLLFALSKRVPILEHIMFIGLPIVNWLSLCNVIFGIYVLSYAISVFTISSIPLVSSDHRESGLNVPEGVLEIIDCLIFWFAEYEVITHVPAFKHHKILGLHTHDWIEVSIFNLIVYNIISLSTYMMVWFLQEVVCENLDPGIDKKSRRYLLIEKFLRKKYIVYCANGMKHSINFILSSLLLLVTWVLYFGSHLNRTPDAKNVLEFGTWTCVSFLTCSFLWLIKTCVLLSWEAHTVYNRLHSRIIEGGKQLYFLGVIGRHNHDIFNLLYECGSQEVSGGGYVEELKRLRSDLCNTLFPTRVIKLDTRYQKKSDKVDVWGGTGVNVKKLCQEKKKRVEDDLLTQQRNTMYCAQLVAGYFFTAKKTLLQEKFTFDIFKSLKSCSEDDDDNSRDWEYFECQLHEFVDSSDETSLERRLEKWVERASNNCVFLANTLSSAKEVVDCLNKIISCLLIAATFILWLLLTGLATTKVLVLIASPLLAATFVFGDTCKTLFQGIIFVFVVHPFYVGDLCVIDANMMEVRTVGIWKTTLSKISTQEEVIYSNVELFNKNIINHKANFDWNDYVELDVSSLDKDKIKILKKEIEEYLDGDKDKLTTGYNSVEVLTNGDNMKLTVYFRHRVNLKNHTYFECLKEKRKLRSEFVLHTEDLMDLQTADDVSDDQTEAYLIFPICDRETKMYLCRWNQRSEESVDFVISTYMRYFNKQLTKGTVVWLQTACNSTK